MTDQSQSLRDEAYDLIDRFLRNNLDDADYATFSAALDVLYTQQAAAHPTQGEVEPVAWMAEYGQTTNIKRIADGWASNGGKITPLYLAAQPQAEPSSATVPSDEQIHDIAEKFGVWEPNGWIFGTVRLMQFARAVLALAAPAAPADARTHDVETAFDQFKAWPCVTSINNLRMKLDEAERYITLLKGVKSL